MNNGVGQWLFTAQRIDVLLLGIGFTAAALFYLSVEILRYPLAHTPTLGKWRWMRFGWIMLFLLIGAALLASPFISATSALFYVPFPCPFSFVLVIVLPVNLLLLLRNWIDEVRRALVWRQTRAR